MKFSNFFFIVFLFLKQFVYGDVNENEIVIRISGGSLNAKDLAEELRYFYIGQVKGFEDTYIFLPKENQSFPVSKRNSELVFHKRLARDPRVLWYEHSKIKTRQKRDLFLWYPDILESRDLAKKNKRPVPVRFDSTFNDELWSQEWYLRDTRTRQDLPKLDLNVLPLYEAGITGKGVRVSILDDGIEHTHEDLKQNYDPEISYDCNEEDDDPLPRYDVTRQNSHGTRCAGEVAMAANNGKCGVGIAYNAKIGGVKLLDGLVNDRIEGTALSTAQNLVDIYSASWGPTDDGKTVDGPGTLAKEALKRGVSLGRNGKGNIFVWASGNGGSNGDNCNCDGYLNSPYTISIGSASQKGEFPWYGEECASTLAVTYSSGAYQDQMIATTDLNNQCTIKHTGTSASAPLAAGIIALALEVNPRLTWRDVQHLIVWTSEVAPVIENPGWFMNAAGFWFNTRFGFGLMNAFSLVKAASNWTTVPEKTVCVIKDNSLRGNRTLFYGIKREVRIYSDSCRGEKNEVNYLEHVEVNTNLDYSRRGSLEITLVSPSGTKVEVLTPRKLDSSDQGFRDWNFMSVMTWGESGAGNWIVQIQDKIGPKQNKGKIGALTLILHGTKTIPEHMKKGNRIYDEEYNMIKTKDNFDYY